MAIMTLKKVFHFKNGICTSQDKRPSSPSQIVIITTTPYIIIFVIIMTTPIIVINVIVIIKQGWTGKLFFSRGSAGRGRGQDLCGGEGLGQETYPD